MKWLSSRKSHTTRGRLLSRAAISTAPTLLGGQVGPTCPSASGNSTPVLMLQEKLWVKLTHDMKLERGSVVSFSFIFTNPPEYNKKEAQ